MKSLGPLSEKRIDGWRERGALDRDAAVGLDEVEKDVLATQTGQQPAARDVAKRVMPDLFGEDAFVVDVGLHRTYLADEE
ncbi:MAG TPA: hypothetical protein VGF46_05400, partial [Gaiellales bacterium]